MLFYPAAIVYKNQEEWDAYVATKSELVPSTKMNFEQFLDLMAHKAEAGFQAKLKRGCLQNHQLKEFVEQHGPAGKFLEMHQNDIELGGRRVFNLFLNINRGEDSGAPELVNGKSSLWHVRLARRVCPLRVLFCPAAVCRL